MFAVLIDQFWALTIAGLALGFIYVLISLGYTMVYGVLRMINFANSEIFMWGTFGTVITSCDIFKYTQVSEPATGFKLALVLLSSLLMSMLVAGLTAVFVEFVAYRRLRMRGTNRLATLISAIGISIVLSEIMRLLTDSRPVGSPRVLEKTILTEVWGANIRLDTVITIFAAAIMFPLFIPANANVDKLLRVAIGISIFESAYIAEVVRGGLQSLPKGQYEAAKSLGMGYWKMNFLIILPQAIKTVIPGITNTFIALFKDTPLIILVGLLELLGMVNLAKSNSYWLGFAVEGYVFVGIIFWVFSYLLSRYTQSLEKKYSTEKH